MRRSRPLGYGPSGFVLQLRMALFLMQVDKLYATAALDWSGNGMFGGGRSGKRSLTRLEQ
jgi:hypothetical protein